MVMKMKLLPLVLLLVCNFAAISMEPLVNHCPPVEEMYPCGCVSVDKGVRLECIRVKDLGTLRRAINSLTTFSSKATEILIDFVFLKFERIPSDLFSGVPVNKISMVNCELGEIGDKGKPAFLGLENSLEELSVTFSFPEENGLKFLNLSNLRSLEHLEIEGNAIDVLVDDWFRDGPKSLQNVIFMTNSIGMLGLNAFAPLTNTKNLWITGNQFGAIYRSMLPSPALHLISLDLSSNHIANLPKDIFSEMPSLREVILDENKIVHLSESTWSPVWQQLSRLYLKDNPLSCDRNINWLLRIRRPHVIKATCESPPDKNGKELKNLINEAIETDNYSNYDDPRY